MKQLSGVKDQGTSSDDAFLLPEDGEATASVREA